MKIYLVKMNTVVVQDDPTDNSEEEVTVYVTTELDKAEEIVDTYGVKVFLWIEEYETDTVY